MWLARYERTYMGLASATMNEDNTKRKMILYKQLTQDLYQPSKLK